MRWWCYDLCKGQPSCSTASWEQSSAWVHGCPWLNLRFLLPIGSSSSNVVWEWQWCHWTNCRYFFMIYLQILFSGKRLYQVCGLPAMKHLFTCSWIGFFPPSYRLSQGWLDDIVFAHPQASNCTRSITIFYFLISSSIFPYSYNWGSARNGRITMK